MTREELSELDRRIAASVARGEAAIARQEAAVARQQEATAQIEAAAARNAKSEQHIEEILVELREGRDERRAMIEGLMRMIDRLPPPQAAS